MARFRFAYETLLEQRRLVENDRQRELAQLMRSRMIFMDQLRMMQNNITESKRELGVGLVGKVDLTRIAVSAGYSQQMTRRGHEIVRKLAGLEREIDSARETLLDATRQRKALELLREKQHRRWQEGIDRRETAELDEIATVRHVRRRMLEGVR